MVVRSSAEWEAIMRFRITGTLLLGTLALAAPAAAQNAPAPSAITRTLVAATKLPTVTNVPLYFKAMSVTLPPGEASTLTVPNAILYQIAGSTEVSLGDEAKTLAAGEGMFIPAGSRRS